MAAKDGQDPLDAATEALPPEALPEDVHTVALGLGDLNGLMRGKRVSAGHWPSVRRRGVHLDVTSLAMDVGSAVIPTPHASPETGFPDLAILPRGPLRPIPWEPGVALCLGRPQDTDGAPLPLDPRQPLLRAVEQARAMGYEPRLAGELEF
ncbi:MAG: glutamine synthetase family protein, partial [Pseudomonadota bacterium]